MKLLREQFVPVALTIHGVYQDAEGEFWNSIKKQCTYRTGNHHAVTPAGNVLCPTPNCNSGSVGSFCKPKEAFDRWTALPEAERRPGAVQVEDLKTKDARFPERPAGSLVLKGYNRPLERGPGGELKRVKEYWDCQELSPESVNWKKFVDPEPGRTWVWLTREQWTSIVPADLKPGKTFPVPDAAAGRLVRLPLLNTMY